METRSTPGGHRSALPAEVPLFPLPDHVLLPGVTAPYRIFEPRYRALVQDLADRPEEERWIAIPRLAPGWKRDYHGSPPFFEVATVGHIQVCDTLEGGHWFVTVEGMARCRLVERPSERPYRVAGVEPLTDLPSGDGAVVPILDDMIRAVRALAMLLGPTASDLTEALSERPDHDRVVFRLGAGALDRPDDRQALLEERRPERRAAMVRDALVDLVALASRHCGALAEG